MTPRTLASAAAALSLAGAAMLGMSAPAVAQDYPPAQPASISDETVVLGQTVTANSGAGSCPTDSTAQVTVFDDTSAAPVAANGNASTTFTVPGDARPGRNEVVFTCAGNRIVIPFTVVAAQAANPGRGQLPQTGSDQLVPLTIAGVALVGIGAGIVVASRRRRETMPGGLA